MQYFLDILGIGLIVFMWDDFPFIVYSYIVLA